MPRYFLKELKIEGFRGINNEGEPLVLSFKTDQVNSVFAANALGKSSAFEALSFAIKGVVPKLERLPASENPSSYYANRFHSTGTSTVHLSIVADDGSGCADITVMRDPSGKRIVMSPSGFPKPVELLHSLDTELALLDHEMFLEFVNDTPLRRGRTFSGLLGLSPLSEFRQVLEVLSNRRNLNTDFELDTLQSLKVREQEIGKEAEKNLRAAYRAFFSEDPDFPLNTVKIGDSTLAALKSVPAIAGAITTSSLAEVDFEAIRTAIRKAEASEKRDRLGKVLQSIGLLQSLEPPASQTDEEARLRIALEGRAAALKATRGTLFYQLYSAVQSLYDEHVWTDPLQCPACDSSLVERLPEQVAQKLQQYKDAEDGLKTVHDLWQTSSWPLRLKNLEEANVLNIPLEGRRHAQWSAKFEGPQPSVADLDAAISDLYTLEAAREKALLQLLSEKDQLESELPASLVELTEQVEHASDLQKGIEIFEKSVKKQADLGASFNLRSAWAKFIESVSSEFARAEVRLSTNKTTALESDYRQMYERVTNNPDIVPLLKKSDTSEELHLRLAKFYGLSDLSAACACPLA